MKNKKIISVILSLVMLFSCFSVCALAAGRYYYVVLGDSIAFGSGLVNAYDACYGKLVADTCGFGYANHAVPGATTSDLIYELNKKAVRSDVARADIISISIGGNDFLDEISSLMYDSIVKEEYGKFNEIEFGVYTNISKVIDSIRELNGEAVILLQTLYNPQSGYLKETYQQGVDRINSAVYRCAKENTGVRVIDVASELDGDARNFADDTLHPSARGNLKIARKVLLTLNKLGYTDKTEIKEKFPGVNVEIGPGVSKTLDCYAFILYAMAKVLRAVSVIMR